MPRTKSFDRGTVVRAARTLFWQVGFESASIPDLEAATGLSRSSLYNSFGSKRGLFDAAVRSYLDEVIRPRLGPLEADVVAPEAITDYLRGLRDAFGSLDSMPSTSGCLLINTAGAPIARDAEVARVISGYRRELTAAITRGIEARGPQPGVDIGQLADAVTGLVVASFALARVDPSQSARTLEAALLLIEG